MLLVAFISGINVYFHRDHVEAAAGSFIVGYFACFGIYMLTCVGVSGYMLRVVKQPVAVDFLKLPKWSNPVSLLKDGFLALAGWVVYSYLMLIPAIVLSIMVLFPTFAAGDHFSESPWISSGIGVIGYSLYFLILIVAYVVILLTSPILVVRYAYTGRFRDMLSPRWAWRALTIAPGEYLLRTSAWSILLTVVTILTPLTAGVAVMLGYCLMPLAILNTAYLIGDYYAKYLDD